MPLNRNILVLDKPNSIYDMPFKEHGTILHSEGTLEDCDLVVFTGGEDVDPALYGDKKHPTTRSNSERDVKERTIFTQAYIMAIPMVGICRGAQFLNVMNNGRLIQNINNHAIMGTHSIETRSGETLQVTSTHHQLMVPSEGDILAWSVGHASVYETGGDLSPQELLQPFRGAHGHVLEPDVVYWPRTNALGVQYHPEYMNPDSDGWIYFQKLLHKYIFRTEK